MNLFLVPQETIFFLSWVSLRSGKICMLYEDTHGPFIVNIWVSNVMLFLVLRFIMTEMGGFGSSVPVTTTQDG
jgi:hypothetical protein